MPWPPISATTEQPSARAKASIAAPISESRTPGRTRATPASRQRRAVSTRCRASGLGRPTKKVALVSPCQPPSWVVTSRLTMSPSRRMTVSRGIPWQTTSLGLTQRLAGKPW